MGICHPHVELKFFSPCLSVLDVVSCTVITTHGWRTSTSARPKVGEFILMLTITAYLLAPVTSVEIVPYLKALINEHHESFCRLYFDSPFIPKCIM